MSPEPPGAAGVGVVGVGVRELGADAQQQLDGVGGVDKDVGGRS